MSLFDGKPLTVEEVTARALCRCGATRSEHKPVDSDEGLYAQAHAQYHADDHDAECDYDCEFEPGVWCVRTGCKKFREATR